MENHHLVRDFSHSTWWIFPVRYVAVYLKGYHNHGLFAALIPHCWYPKVHSKKNHKT